MKILLFTFFFLISSSAIACVPKKPGDCAGKGMLFDSDMFAEGDINNDKKLTQEEHYFIHRANNKAVFSCTDKNSDGFLDLEEFENDHQNCKNKIEKNKIVEDAVKKIFK